MVMATTSILHGPQGMILGMIALWQGHNAQPGHGGEPSEAKIPSDEGSKEGFANSAIDDKLICGHVDCET